MPGPWPARVHDQVGPQGLVDPNPLGGEDADEGIVDRPLQRAAVHDHLVLVREQRGLPGALVLEELVAPPPDRVPEQDRTLDHVRPVAGPGLPRVPGRRRHARHHLPGLASGESRHESGLGVEEPLRIQPSYPARQLAQLGRRLEGGAHRNVPVIRGGSDSLRHRALTAVSGAMQDFGCLVGRPEELRPGMGRRIKKPDYVIVHVAGRRDRSSLPTLSKIDNF